MAQTPQTIEQPKNGAVPSGVETRVFTMPERYRHGAEWKMHESATKAPGFAPVEVKTPVFPAPKAPPKLLTQKKTNSTKKILIVGVAVLLLLGIGGYVLVRSVEVPPKPETTTTSRPAPVREEVTEVEEVAQVEEDPEPESESEVFPTEVTPGTDTDSDGLTDVEETLVYNTDPKRPDTDADGFLDGNEVFHGYNPGGTAPGTLFESGLVEQATGAMNGTSYEYVYPSVWNLEEVEGEMVLDAQTGEGFRISVVEGELPEGDVRTTKTGLSYILSDDQLTATIELGSVIFMVEYDTGIKSKVDYLQTFQMMLNSVTYDSTSTEPVDPQGGTEASTQAAPESP
ncbi:hypothetical protein HY626_00185 [Candidatus Uhrbacteria bacterium]|nr:hypothetical protein [Candidatus Uhrbacteria bacterium]